MKLIDSPHQPPSYHSSVAMRSMTHVGSTNERDYPTPPKIHQHAHGPFLALTPKTQLLPRGFGHTSKSVVCTEEFTIYGGFKSDTPLPGWSNFGERQSHNGTVRTRPSKSGQTHNHVSTVKSFSAMIRCIENQRKHHPKICAKCSPLTLSKGLKKRTPSHENVNTFLGGDVGPWENQLF